MQQIDKSRLLQPDAPAVAPATSQRVAAGTRGSELLAPESVEEKRRPGIIALRDKLRAQFEVTYAKEIGRPIDPRVAKLAALIDRPGTVGEGEAAQAALERVTGAA